MTDTNKNLNKRNIGIIAHIDAGKTTTTERILRFSGRIYKMGEVHDGKSTMDYLEDERKRGITIQSAATSCSWTTRDGANHDITIIDTPGHVDFTMEVERSMRVLDGAVVVLDPVDGVQTQTETVCRQADKYKVPRIFFINKMDRMGANFEMCIKMIRTILGMNPIVLQLPIGRENEFNGVIDLVDGKAYYWNDISGMTYETGPIPSSMNAEYAKYRELLLEHVCSVDDALAEKYLNGEELTREEVLQAVRKSAIDMTGAPVLCGSAFKNKGVQLLLDGICQYLPSPLDLADVVGVDNLGDAIIRSRDAKSQFTALAFKILHDQYIGRMVFVRVYSGIVSAGSYVLNATKNKRERIGRMMIMHANAGTDITKAEAGDIVVLCGLGGTDTGDTLCNEGDFILLERIIAPQPVIELAVISKSKSEHEKLIGVLSKMIAEDPSLTLSFNQETGQTLIKGMGELQIEIVVDRIRRDHGLDISVGSPQVAYRETATKEATINYVHKKQTGGAGQFAEVKIVIFPGERGSGIVFQSKIFGGAIPKEFISSIEEGIKSSASAGVLAGFPIIDFKCELIDGSFHAVDSNAIAFETAGYMACREAMKKADMILLEPMMKVEVITPEEFTGVVSGDVSRRRGRILGSDQRGNAQVIQAIVPLKNMFGYVSVLRSLTQGRATYSMQFDNYEQVPVSVAEEIIKGAK